MLVRRVQSAPGMLTNTTDEALATKDHVLDEAPERPSEPDAEPDPSTPSSLLVPEAKAIRVLVDEAAASRLYFTGEPQ